MRAARCPQEPCSAVQGWGRRRLCRAASRHPFSPPTLTLPASCTLPPPLHAQARRPGVGACRLRSRRRRGRRRRAHRPRADRARHAGPPAAAGRHLHRPERRGGGRRPQRRQAPRLLPRAGDAGARRLHRLHFRRRLCQVGVPLGGWLGGWVLGQLGGVGREQQPCFELTAPRLPRPHPHPTAGRSAPPAAPPAAAAACWPPPTPRSCPAARWVGLLSCGTSCALECPLKNLKNAPSRSHPTPPPSPTPRPSLPHRRPTPPTCAPSLRSKRRARARPRVS